MTETKRRRKTKPAQERFFAKIAGGDVDTCWEWTGARNGWGYGNFRSDGRNYPAHRWSYEFFHGPIPSGLHLDHLCRVRHCVNPWHLDPVTAKVNIRRGLTPELNRARNKDKTHCSRGHEYNDANTYANPNNGWRYCRICIRVSQKRWAERQKTA